MEKEYDEIVDEEDDIIEFEIIDGKMYLSLENVNKSIDQATKNYKKVIDKEIVMNKEEILNTFLLANIPEIITQEEFNDVKKAIKQLLQENQKYKEVIDKAIEFTNKKWGTWCTHHLEYMTELQNILKEVSE